MKHETAVAVRRISESMEMSRWRHECEVLPLRVEKGRVTIPLRQICRKALMNSSAGQLLIREDRYHSLPNLFMTPFSGQFHKTEGVVGVAAAKAKPR